MAEPTAPMSDERLAEIRTWDAERNRLTVEKRPNSAVAHRHELLAYIDQLRGALADIGKVRTEWGVQHPLFGVETMDGPINASAACLQRNASSVRQKWTVATRLVGEWREAD